MANLIKIPSYTNCSIDVDDFSCEFSFVCAFFQMEYIIPQMPLPIVVQHYVVNIKHVPTRSCISLKNRLILIAPEPYVVPSCSVDSVV